MGSLSLNKGAFQQVKGDSDATRQYDEGGDKDVFAVMRRELAPAKVGSANGVAG